MKKILNIKLKSIHILLCVCMAILLLPCKVNAAPEEEMTRLTIKYPVGNVEFEFYKIAEFSEYGEFELIYPFDMYADEIQNLENLEKNTEVVTTETWVELATTLESYVVSERLSYDFLEKTSESGRITIENIEKGLYLILGDMAATEEKTYTPAPVLMTVPNRDEAGNWDSQVVLDYTSKTAINDIHDEYTVQKIWEDDGNETKRPDEIVVELYMKGEEKPYDTQVLSVKNNWKYTWTDLPIGNEWTVSEKVIPDNYKVSYIKEGTDLLVVNAYDSPSTPQTPGSSLPQTGQLWWPVPFLVIFGIAFLAIGLAKRNNKEGR